MKLSEKAWKKSEDIYQAITQHPFNQELIKGTLPQEKFGYYIEQDSIYLKSLARVFAKIAALSENIEDIKQFSKFALDSIIIGEGIVNKFTKNELNLEMTGNITNATSNYVEYLFDISTTQSIEIIVDAVLPAFWIYHEVGLYIAKNTTDNNPSTSLLTNQFKGVQTTRLANRVKAPIAAGDVKPIAANPTPIPNETPINTIEFIRLFNTFPLNNTVTMDNSTGSTEPTIPPAIRGAKLVKLRQKPTPDPTKAPTPAVTPAVIPIAATTINIVVTWLNLNPSFSCVFM